MSADRSPSVVPAPISDPAPPTTAERVFDLAPLEEGDAPALLGILSSQRGAFDPWLRWSSGIRDLAAARAFIAAASERERAGNGFHLGIRREGALVGGVVCWYIHAQHRNCELGYWLDPAVRGQGLVHLAMGRVITRLFGERGLHRVELQCAVHNIASRRVAERLGFELEGVRRGSHWITDRFVDHAVYGLVAPPACLWAAPGHFSMGRAPISLPAPPPHRPPGSPCAPRSTTSSAAKTPRPCAPAPAPSRSRSRTSTRASRGTATSPPS